MREYDIVHKDNMEKIKDDEEEEIWKGGHKKKFNYQTTCIEPLSHLINNMFLLDL